jgi:hypothetical protein
MMSFRLLGMWMRMWMRGLMFSCAVGVGLIGLPAAGVVLGQVDDFQDGTFQNWGGGASPLDIWNGPASRGWRAACGRRSVARQLPRPSGRNAEVV